MKAKYSAAPFIPPAGTRFRDLGDPLNHHRVPPLPPSRQPGSVWFWKEFLQQRIPDFAGDVEAAAKLLVEVEIGADFVWRHLDRLAREARPPDPVVVVASELPAHELGGIAAGHLFVALRKDRLEQLSKIGLDDPVEINLSNDGSDTKKVTLSLRMFMRILAVEEAHHAVFIYLNQQILPAGSIDPTSRLYHADEKEFRATRWQMRFAKDHGLNDVYEYLRRIDKDARIHRTAVRQGQLSPDGRPLTVDQLCWITVSRLTEIFHARSHMTEVDQDANATPSFSWPEGVVEISGVMARRLQHALNQGRFDAPARRRQLATDILALIHECAHSLGPDAREDWLTTPRAANDMDHIFAEGLVEWAAQYCFTDVIIATGLAETYPWLTTIDDVHKPYEAARAFVGEIVEHVAHLRQVSPAQQAGELFRARGPGSAVDRLAEQWAAAVHHSLPATDLRAKLSNALRLVQFVGDPASSGSSAANTLIRDVHDGTAPASPSGAVRTVA